VDNTATSVIFTWVFLHTRGSLLMAILLHGAINVFSVSSDLTSSGGFTLLLLSMGAQWLVVIVLVVVLGPKLARGPHPEALPKV